jgi:hypothetical protein
VPPIADDLDVDDLDNRIAGEVAAGQVEPDPAAMIGKLDAGPAGCAVQLPISDSRGTTLSQTSAT